MFCRGTKSAGLVLAAGRGSRFAAESGDPFPKVLRKALGKPLVRYVIDALTGAGVDDITLIVGFGASAVIDEVGPDVGYVEQTEQKGSGHAVACARDAFRDFDGTLIIMCGDSPLFTSDTVNEMRLEHTRSEAAITLASATLDDPFGYGRILRDGAGSVVGVVEEKCADEAQKAIREVNGGIYACDSRWLFGNIDQMAVNEAGEYNLTDMVRVAIEQNRRVSTVECDPVELMGVNTPQQLQVVEQILRGR
ncbi:MAG: NTP transferase domain-containing protein [Armatimonadota bacterium]